MLVMSRRQEKLVQRLVDLAGSPIVLHAALCELRAEGDPSGLEVLVRKIVEVRDREAHTHNSA